jgi:effector-binding domain-containing protein
MNSIKKSLIVILMTVITGAAAFHSNAQNFTIEVKNVNAQKALVLTAETKSSEIGQSMGEAYGKLFGFLGQQQIEPAGPPFAVYHAYDPQGNTKYEAGVPVTENFQAPEGMLIKEYPAMKVVTTHFTGPYEKMEPVYVALEKYIKDNKLSETGGPWEVYLTDPMETAPDKNQTVVYFPVK